MVIAEAESLAFTASSGTNNNLFKYDLFANTAFALIGHSADVTVLVLAPEDKYLFSADASGLIIKRHIISGVAENLNFHGG